LLSHILQQHRVCLKNHLLAHARRSEFLEGFDLIGMLFARQSSDPNALGCRDMRNAVAFESKLLPIGRPNCGGVIPSYGVEHRVARPIVLANEVAEVVVRHQVQYKEDNVPRGSTTAWLFSRLGGFSIYPR
jgi:hypothetical protein